MSPSRTLLAAALLCACSGPIGKGRPADPAAVPVPASAPGHPAPAHGAPTASAGTASAPDPAAAPAPSGSAAANASADSAPGRAAPAPLPPGSRTRVEGAVLIRLRNAADTLELRSVYAVFPDDTVLFGDLPPKGVSAYHAVKRAYRYAYVRAHADGREWALQPADYVGEKLLEPGRYTWSIKPHEGPYPGFLDFEAVRDGDP